ncbi:MAG: cache domain-containing protein [Saccharofermentanales bacterium]
MNRIIKTVYGIVLLCAILVVTGVFIEYRLFNYVLREELKKNISLEKELVALSVESELMVNAQVIEDAYSFLKFSDDDKTIRDYFKLLLDSEPIFTSIYYVDKNNNMINGSGWVPPSELDLRERIWYKKAISEGELIFTEAFLNASRDALIVTIAKPVPDGNGGFAGVIAGDMSIADIIDLVPSLSAFESSFSFMTDGEGNILAYPEIVVDPDKELVNIREISADLAGIILNNGTGLHDVEIDGVPGYISYRMIDGTNWKIGSFIKIE